MNEAAIEPLYTEAEIQSRVTGMAQEIARSLPPDMLIVALLRGSFVFTADLIRALYRCQVHPQIDFMTLSSYGEALESSGEIIIHRDVADAIAGKNVLIVDDILESGRTLAFAHRLLSERGAKSLHVAVLLEKPGKCKTDVKADFVGFSVPDRFVVGYGLDAANRWRELPFIGTIAAP